MASNSNKVVPAPGPASVGEGGAEAEAEAEAEAQTSDRVGEPESESPPANPIGQPSTGSRQDEVNTIYMDPRLYKAAAGGKLNDLGLILVGFCDIENELTPTRNTVLHVAAQSRTEPGFLFIPS